MTKNIFNAHAPRQQISLHTGYNVNFGDLFMMKYFFINQENFAIIKDVCPYE